jgi:4-aminobutyrate aminotransferase-like enzyme
MGEKVKFLDRNNPTLSENEARQVAMDLFGLEGDFKSLTSERDQNYRITTPDNKVVVFKIANVREEYGVLDFQTKTLLHIEEQNSSLITPRVIPNKQGEPISQFTASTGDKHDVHVLSYLPGNLLVEAEYNPNLLRNLGAVLAKVDLALRSFHHANAGHEIVWDVMRCLQLRPHTQHIADVTVRKNVESVFERMEKVVLPKLKNMRHQVIHADAHNLNTLFDPNNPNEVAGILDFGDMHFAPLPMELAVAADFDHFPIEHWVDALCALTQGYDRVLPLEEAEIDVIFDLVLCRFAMVATVIAWRNNNVETDQPAYLPDSPGTKILAYLLNIGHETVNDRLRQACRFPAYCALDKNENHEFKDDIDSLMQRRHTVLSKHLTHFYKKPLHVERGRGAYLFDKQGNAYVDAYNNVPTVGHCHPHVVNAVSRQMAALNTNTRYVYQSILDYAEKLTSTLPKHLSACLFVNSGSEANDVAWQIATHMTKKRGGIVMENAYHGITEAIDYMSPFDPEKRPVAPHIGTLISPDTYRGQYRRDNAQAAQLYAKDADRVMAELEQKGFGTACFMLDSTFMSNGIPDAPADYAHLVAEKVRANGGVIIADEVQSGFGRMGQMWGFTLQGFHPDIVTLGKPVGNGYPLGVVVTTPEILNDFTDATGLFSTFGGNPVACAAGLAVLDVVEQEQLVESSKNTGIYLRNGLKNLMEKHALIGDVRGSGLVCGVEFVKNRDTLEPISVDTTKQIVELMREHHVLVGKEGYLGNVMKIRPPLAFKKPEADKLIDALDKSLKKIC